MSSRIKPISKPILAFYINGGGWELIPIYPLYAVMFGAHGVSPIELSYLLVMCVGVGLICEVPSGALVDTFSRKWLIVSSSFLKGLAFLSWFLWQDFWGYALGFTFWGIGGSLRSGACKSNCYIYRWPGRKSWCYLLVYDLRRDGRDCLDEGSIVWPALTHYPDLRFPPYTWAQMAN